MTSVDCRHFGGDASCSTFPILSLGEDRLIQPFVREKICKVNIYDSHIEGTTLKGTKVTINLENCVIALRLHEIALSKKFYFIISQSDLGSYLLKVCPRCRGGGNVPTAMSKDDLGGYLTAPTCSEEDQKEALRLAKEVKEVNADIKGSCPLVHAVHNGWFDVAEALLSRHAKIPDHLLWWTCSKLDSGWLGRISGSNSEIYTAWKHGLCKKQVAAYAVILQERAQKVKEWEEKKAKRLAELKSDSSKNKIVRYQESYSARNPDGSKLKYPIYESTDLEKSRPEIVFPLPKVDAFESDSQILKSKIASLLIRFKANIHYVPESKEERDGAENILLLAMERGWENIALECIEAGVQIPPDTFHLTVRKGRRWVMANLLKRGTDPNRPEGNRGPTPFMLILQRAWGASTIEDAKLFLENRANPNLVYMGQSEGIWLDPISSALESSNPDVCLRLLNLLFQFGAKPREWPPKWSPAADKLKKVIENNWKDVLELLDQQGVKIPKMDPATIESLMRKIVENGWIDILKILLKSGWDATKLPKSEESLVLFAMKKNQVAIALLFLDHQANPDYQQPIFHAIETGCSAVAKRLVECNASLSVGVPHYTPFLASLTENAKREIDKWQVREKIDQELLSMMLSRGANPREIIRLRNLSLKLPFDVQDMLQDVLLQRDPPFQPLMNSVTQYICGGIPEDVFKQVQEAQVLGQLEDGIKVALLLAKILLGFLDEEDIQSQETRMTFSTLMIEKVNRILKNRTYFYAATKFVNIPEIQKALQDEMLIWKYGEKRDLMQSEKRENERQKKMTLFEQMLATQRSTSLQLSDIGKELSLTRQEARAHASAQSDRDDEKIKTLKSGFQAVVHAVATHH